jgi:putative phosphoribosyl transferase
MHYIRVSEVMMKFRDREEGGYRLAGKLEAYRTERPIVLALPRGGVPVAFQVAIALGARLDVLVVRKDGSLERGARVPPPGAILSERALRDARHAAALRALAYRQTPELARRLREARGDRPALAIGGQPVILVDDMLATGERARSASLIVRQRGAAKIIVAAPVIARAAELALDSVAEAFAAVQSVPGPLSIRDWYERIEDVSDDAVIAYLERALVARTPAGFEGDLWNGEWIGRREA